MDGPVDLYPVIVPGYLNRLSYLCCLFETTPIRRCFVNSTKSCGAIGECKYSRDISTNFQLLRRVDACLGKGMSLRFQIGQTVMCEFKITYG